MANLGAKWKKKQIMQDYSLFYVDFGLRILSVSGLQQFSGLSKRYDKFSSKSEKSAYNPEVLFSQCLFNGYATDWIIESVKNQRIAKLNEITRKNLNLIQLNKSIAVFIVQRM